MRGLKHASRIYSFAYKWVAPLVGAWIETQVRAPFNYVALVAPLVGAWIETIYLVSLFNHTFVAPLVGAWIETF